jgi:hypothetical protein
MPRCIKFFDFTACFLSYYALKLLLKLCFDILLLSYKTSKNIFTWSSLMCISGDSSCANWRIILACPSLDSSKSGVYIYYYCMLPSRQLFLAFHATNFGYFFGQGLSPSLPYHAQQQPCQV